MIEEATQAIIIENVSPALDAGRYPVKREVGNALVVEADILKEGHDVLAAVLNVREKNSSQWHESPMQHLENDRWRGQFLLEKNPRYCYTVEAWQDAFETWRRDLEKRVAASMVARASRRGAKYFRVHKAPSPARDRRSKNVRNGCPKFRRWVLTCCTWCRFIRLARSIAREKIIPRRLGQTIRVARTPLVLNTAGTWR